MYNIIHVAAHRYIAMACSQLTGERMVYRKLFLLFVELLQVAIVDSAVLYELVYASLWREGERESERKSHPF